MRVHFKRCAPMMHQSCDPGLGSQNGGGRGPQVWDDAGRQDWPPVTHVPRMEYLISGVPLEQISCAEPLVKSGETWLSPQAWAYARDSVIEGPLIEERAEFHLLLRMDESSYTLPAIKYATQLRDTRAESMFMISELEIARRYIPSLCTNKSRADPSSTSMRCESSLSSSCWAAVSM